MYIYVKKSGEILYDICSCKAGSGGCYKHVAAVLYQLVEYKLGSDLFSLGKGTTFAHLLKGNCYKTSFFDETSINEFHESELSDTEISRPGVDNVIQKLDSAQIITHWLSNKHL